MSFNVLHRIHVKLFHKLCRRPAVEQGHHDSLAVVRLLKGLDHMGEHGGLEESDVTGEEGN